jgi:hypothetical protein
MAVQMAQQKAGSLDFARDRLFAPLRMTNSIRDANSIGDGF